MGTNYYAVKTSPTLLAPIHIGKSSIGWKFLFHKIDAWENWASEESIRTFPQMKKFLEENIKAGEIVIMNEYDEVVDLQAFLDIVERKQGIENPDNFTNAENIDGYRFTDGDFS